MTSSVPSDDQHVHIRSHVHHDHDHKHHHAPADGLQLASPTLMQSSAIARLGGAIAILTPIWVVVYLIIAS